MSNLDVGMMFSKIQAATGKSTTSAYGTGKGIDVGQLLHNFGCCCLVVSTAIVHIVKLVGPTSVWNFVGETTTQLDVVVVVSIGFGINFNESCTCLTERILLFLG